jgi:diguanylate cyclase (GGDEF)-like protein
VAERILDAVAMELTDSSGQSYRITTSMGLGSHHPADRSLRDLLDRADQALYLAKHRGHNQIAMLGRDRATCPFPARNEARSTGDPHAL